MFGWTLSTASVACYNDPSVCKNKKNGVYTVTMHSRGVKCRNVQIVFLFKNNSIFKVVYDCILATVVGAWISS